MRDEIYTLLNYIDTPNIELQNTDNREIKNWMKQFRSKTGKNKKIGIRIGYTATTVMLVSVLSFFSPLSSYASDGMKILLYDIAELLGIDKNLSPYSQILEETITGEDFSITLNEVICDEDTMQISYTTTSNIELDTYEKESDVHTDVNVFVNGRRASTGVSGFIKKVDDYNIVSCYTAELPEVSFEKEVDVELIFYDHESNDIGSVSFFADGSELLADTKEILLDQEFLLPDSSVIKFYKYTSNDLGQRIYFTTSNKENNYDISLKGHDNIGNEVVFNLRYADEKGGRLEVATLINGYISEDAHELILIPYAYAFPEESGEMKEEFVELTNKNEETNTICIDLS